MFILEALFDRTNAFVILAQINIYAHISTLRIEIKDPTYSGGDLRVKIYLDLYTVYPSNFQCITNLPAYYMGSCPV